MKTILVFLFVLLTSTLFAQTDSLVFEFGKDMTVYKDTESQTYTIKRGKKTVWKDLKFLYPTYGYLQVLDKKNSFFYIDDNGKKSETINISLGLCGTVPHYTYKIIETQDYYVLTEDETFYDYENLEPPVEKGSISKEGIQKICFYNNEREMNMTSNSFVFNATRVFPQAMIIEKGNRKGIFYDNELSFYDEIVYKDGLFKVKQNNLVGYYKITEPKYEELAEFTFGLAQFKLENGKTGFIDKDGKEYYD